MPEYYVNLELAMLNCLLKPVDGLILRETIEYVTYAIAMLVMSSITFSIVHLYLLNEMSTYLVIIQIEHVHFLFSILPHKKKSLLCKLCKYLQIVKENTL